MKLTNAELLNVQEGINRLNVHLTAMNKEGKRTNLSAKIQYAINKNFPQLTKSLVPYFETTQPIWEKAGATLENNQWKLPNPEKLEGEEKEKAQAAIEYVQKEMESLLTQECEVDLHVAAVEGLHTEENELPYDIIPLMMPMLSFE